MELLLPNLAIAGYRSFGPTIQYFDQFAKVNILIGQNNRGKSNVLRAISKVVPLATNGGFQPDELDRHLSGAPTMLLGVGEPVQFCDAEEANPDKIVHRLILPQVEAFDRLRMASIVKSVLQAKSEYDKTGALCWSMTPFGNSARHEDTWKPVLDALDYRLLDALGKSLLPQHYNNRDSWVHHMLKLMNAKLPSFRSQLIPAIRRIDASGIQEGNFDGTGVVHKLSRLQHPTVTTYHEDRGRFDAITDFLRTITGIHEATLEVPFDNNSLIVTLDNKVLPIESLGTGIHEVIILAAAATVMSNHVVCIEEPELHLNPILQRKLMRYLTDSTDNQYFITTHSAAIMDTPGAEVYHIRMEDGESKVERVTSSHQRSTVCEDLGYHPSDLLQANCVIWVEGPSDRIYLNYWLKQLGEELSEGIHYSIMFYGGRLASHLTYDEQKAAVEDFISLKNLNRRGAILMDSDRDTAGKRLNRTKKRLQQEFTASPGLAWVTAGREVENYLPDVHVSEALAKVHPKTKAIGKLGKWDNVLKLKKGSVPDKVGIARCIVEKYPKADITKHDLTKRLKDLRQFILDSNPPIEKA